MLQTLRYALRMMAKSPGFTAVAVLTLALGIGANTAIFSVVNALLLRSLPLETPDRLVQVSVLNQARGLQTVPFSLSAFESLRDRNRSFSGIAAIAGETFTLTGGDRPEQLAAARVSPNFFDLLGVQPMMGRGFQTAEGEPGGRPVAIVSHSFWKRRFASDPDILGKPLTLSQDVYTIIGVMPPEFPFPRPDLSLWVTRVMKYSVLQPEQIQFGAGYLLSLARLKPGVSMAQGEAEMAVLRGQYRRKHPGAPDASINGRFSLVPLQESLVSDIRPTLMILTGAVALVLLIACANVAGLTLARAAGRAKEIAVRAALGASRFQLIRHLLVESVVLAAAGAALGILLAQWGVEALTRGALTQAGSGTLPGFQPIRVDTPVLAFTVVLSLATGIIFGLMPALQVSRPDLNSILRDGGWGATDGAGRHSTRSLLVAGQMALSIVLLIGAGLLIESFRRLQSVNPGFDPQHALTARVALPPSKYPDTTRRTQFLREVVGRLESMPGVISASAQLSIPMGVGVLSPVLADGQPNVPAGQRPLSAWSSLTPGFFRTMGIPLLRGRDFTWADDAQSPRVLIVSESLARRFWPDENPLGKHCTFTRLQAAFEIVGVAGDTKVRGLDADPGMMMYTPYPQWTWPAMALTIRTAGDPRALASGLRAAVAAVDKDQPVTGVQTLEDAVAVTLQERRQTMYLISGFAAIAMLLAVIGLYGVMAYSVAQRTKEIGIRQAIGAQRADILRMVLGQGMRLSLAGIAVGTAAAVGLTRLIASLIDKMLFHVSATDPLTYAAIALLFLVVALAATYIPAWRATRVDPLAALRQ
ncbi:MAG TPA: ABC transporter permease [Candidatus Acidoferrales bacterium]|nr:ABC transporter permease [Candidatus Acidoferrales bacterium]